MSVLPVTLPFALRIARDATGAIVRAYDAEGQIAFLVGPDGKVQQMFSAFDFMSDTESLGNAPLSGANVTAAIMGPSGAAPHTSERDQVVYAVGRIGYDFGQQARRDSLFQHGGGQVELNNPVEFLAYLKDSPYSAAAVTWTLRVDGIPIYAIRPAGTYASMGYERLRQFLAAQTVNRAYQVSVPGSLEGSTYLANGMEVPLIVPVERGMVGWDPEQLVTAAVGPAPADTVTLEPYQRQREQIYDFIVRIYYELRNKGRLPAERALNYAAGQGFLLKEVFADAVAQRLAFASVKVGPSPVARPGADCWDVTLGFFNPEKRLTQARREYRFTVDVSDLVPVTIGPVRSWMAY